MLPPIFFRALRLFLGLIWLVLLYPAQAFPALADHEQLFQTANDAVYVARSVPTAMIFTPCKDGLSHNEAESIMPEEAEAGCQVLFEAVQQTGLALYGGNIPANQTKEVFKSQGASVSAELQQLLRQARLDDASLKLLRQEIDQGHCSALPAHMFDAMIAVQRARDASMAAVLLQHLPSVLLAGNGHAWKHVGVPQIIRANQPDVRVVSLLLLEHRPLTTRADMDEWLQSWRDKADFIWVTPVRTREDPCLQFKKK